MSVLIEDRYKLIFEHHRFVAEYRLSLIKGWAAVYAALAAVFVWTQSVAPLTSWVVCVIAVFATFLLWAADSRHRPAISVLTDVGQAIENDPYAGIPSDQRYFCKLQQYISHSLLINCAAIVFIVLFSIAAGFLIHSNGKLPGQDP